MMSNHLHMIASASDEGSLSDILRDLKKFTSKAMIQAIEEEAESRRACLPAGQQAFLMAGRDVEPVLVCW
jgi:REP element-mobilizing transposase RayT